MKFFPSLEKAIKELILEELKRNDVLFGKVNSIYSRFGKKLYNISKIHYHINDHSRGIEYGFAGEISFRIIYIKEFKNNILIKTYEILS